MSSPRSAAMAVATSAIRVAVRYAGGVLARSRASLAAAAMIRPRSAPWVTASPTGLNLNHKLSFALSWGSLHRGGPHGTQAHETPPPCRVSAPLADPDASGGRGGTTVAGRAQSVVAGPTPAGTA